MDDLYNIVEGVYSDSSSSTENDNYSVQEENFTKKLKNTEREESCDDEKMIKSKECFFSDDEKIKDKIENEIEESEEEIFSDDEKTKGKNKNEIEELEESFKDDEKTKGKIKNKIGEHSLISENNSDQKTEKQIETKESFTNEEEPKKRRRGGKGRVYLDPNIRIEDPTKRNNCGYHRSVTFLRHAQEMYTMLGIDSFVILIPEKGHPKFQGTGHLKYFQNLNLQDCCKERDVACRLQLKDVALCYKRKSLEQEQEQEKRETSYKNLKKRKKKDKDK